MKYLAASALVAAILLSSACTQSPQKLVEAGNRYHNNKKYTEASILYQKAIAKDKKNAEAYYREGLNLLDSGDLQGAMSYLRRAVDLKPSNMDATTKLAEMYLMVYTKYPQRAKSYLVDATDLIDKINKAQPDSFDGERLQGMLELAKHEPDKAVTHFEKANQIKPYSPDVVTSYAETLYSLQRADEAEALQRDMIAHNPKWGPGYDFLFLMYEKDSEKEKDPATKAQYQVKAKAILEQRYKADPTSAVAIGNLASFDVVNGDYAAGEATMKRVLDDSKAFPNRYEMLGDFYFRAKKFDEARNMYEEGLKQDPKHAVAYNERIVTLDEATNKREDALNLARSVAKDNPKNVQANELYANLLLQGGSSEGVAKSVSELKTLLKSNPNDALLHLDLARAYFDTNDRDKSLTEAQEAMQQASKLPDTPRQRSLIENARILTGRIYEDRGQHAKAMELANLVLQADPQSADGRLIKDRAMVGIGQADQALPDLEQLVNQFPHFGAARLELAMVYVAHKEFDKATAQYQLFSKDFPNDPRGLVGLQDVKMAQGKPDEAIAGIKAILDGRPKDLQLRYQLAAFQAQAGAQIAAKDRNRANQYFDDAANNYKEILKTTTNSADVWLRLGIMQRALQQYDAALASFQQAASADPHNSAPILNQAMLLDGLGKKKEAMAAYNKVLGIDPDNPLAMNNVAFLNAQDGSNLDQAMTMAEKAKQRFPNSPDISDTLGFVYYKKDLNAEALQIFKDLVAQHQDNPTFHLHLAMALEKSGNKQGARDEAQKALQLSAPNQQAPIKSFLAQLG